MATDHYHHHEQSSENLSVKEASVIVLMVPFPAYSHMNQLLQLSCLISSYKLPVHYAGSSFHNPQVRTRAHHALNLSEIHFHDFPIPPYVPDPASDSTEFLLPYFHVTENLRQPVGALVHQLSSRAKKLIIIHDVLTSSAVQVASSITNAETYAFQPITAFTVFCFSCAASSEKFLPIPSELVENVRDPIEIPSLEGAFSYETLNFIARQGHFVKLSASGHIINGCRVIDGAFLDPLAEKENYKKVWAVGPLHHQITCSKSGRNSVNGRDKCLEWLDKQEPNSVLYISFGTTISIGDNHQQLQELALGLELSGTKFIWVFTDADHKRYGFEESEKEHGQELPEGFEDRAKGKGMVVRDWAPQIEILEHKSTGGFLSHCGWNSCLEGISCGVPVAVWPMHSDQPMNALLITKVLKIGVNVKEWANRDREVSSSEISEALSRLMGSDEIRKRAHDLGANVRRAIDNGGLSRLECDSFVAHITT